MAASPTEAQVPENSGGVSMGSNPTQAVAIVFLLISMVLLAGAMAGGGVILAILAVALLVVSFVFFMKCKPWEHQKN